MDWLDDKDKIIGFCGIIHYPHPVNRTLKKVSRLVILPDYQGIGLGTKFLNVVAKYWVKKGYNLGITTSAKNMIFALKKSNEWICTAQHSTAQHSTADYNGLNKSMRHCSTCSFMYRK